MYPVLPFTYGKRVNVAKGFFFLPVYEMKPISVLYLELILRFVSHKRRLVSKLLGHKLETNIYRLISFFCQILSDLITVIIGLFDSETHFPGINYVIFTR